MSAEFSVQPYQDGDEKKILEAFFTVFGKQRTLQEWEWLYRHSPQGARIMLAWSQTGELAAHYACTLHQACSERGALFVGHNMDTFSVQKFRHGGRRGGVVVETFNQFVKQWAGAGAGESAIQYGFPSQRHYRLGRLFMGHRPFSRWHYLRCRVSAQQSTYESQPLGEVGVIERFGDCFDPLWLQQSKRYKLAVVHDAKFLNWRFIEHPNRHYQIWGYSQFLSDRIDGYVVLSVDHSSAYLVDFHFPDNRSGEAANFWGQVCQKLSGIGVKQVDTWFSSASLELLLFRQLGFREAHTPDDMVPVFRSYHPDISSEWIDQNFYYNMADSDIF